jgi:hypothetical protein
MRATRLITGSEDSSFNRLPDENNITRSSKFEDFFKESALRGTTLILGESSAKSVLFHIKFDENSRNPQKIHASLETMLRSLGTVLVEKSIIKQMFSRLKEKIPETLNLSNEDFDFVKGVAYAHKIFDERIGRY